MGLRDPSNPIRPIVYGATSIWNGILYFINNHHILNWAQSQTTILTPLLGVIGGIICNFLSVSTIQWGDEVMWEEETERKIASRQYHSLNTTQCLILPETQTKRISYPSNDDWSMLGWGGQRRSHISKGNVSLPNYVKWIPRCITDWTCKQPLSSNGWACTKAILYEKLIIEQMGNFSIWPKPHNLNCRITIK